MKYRLKMNMKEEVEHSNPLKGLSQKTSLYSIKLKKRNHDHHDHHHKIGIFGQINYGRTLLKFVFYHSKFNKF